MPSLQSRSTSRDLSDETVDGKEMSPARVFNYIHLLRNACVMKTGHMGFSLSKVDPIPDGHVGPGGPLVDVSDRGKAGSGSPVPR